MHSTHGRRRRAWRSGLLASLLLMLLALSPLSSAREYMRGQTPLLFYRALPQQDLHDDYGDVFAIAHNSGDTLHTTRTAVAHGADVVEIDVRSVGGRLHAAHDSPFPVLGAYLFSGPTLEQAWAEAALADVVKLDLKESSPAFVERVARFIDRHPERPIVVVSGSPLVLEGLSGRPVTRVLSISSATQLEALLDAPGLLERIHGVSVMHTVLTPERTERLREANMLIFAYTVNDLRRVNELVQQGVDAITTDNLAIMELLGGPGVAAGQLLGGEA